MDSRSERPVRYDSATKPRQDKRGRHERLSTRYVHRCKTQPAPPNSAHSSKTLPAPPQNVNKKWHSVTKHSISDANIVQIDLNLVSSKFTIFLRWLYNSIASFSHSSIIFQALNSHIFLKISEERADPFGGAGRGLQLRIEERAEYIAHLIAGLSSESDSSTWDCRLCRTNTKSQYTIYVSINLVQVGFSSKLDKSFRTLLSTRECLLY